MPDLGDHRDPARRRPEPLSIFFDVDHTLIDDDHGLRPGARNLLQTLHTDGHRLYLWSGIGPRWEIVELHQLGDIVSDCFDKPLYRHHELLEPLGISEPPDCVVDDHPDPVSVFGGVVVRAYRRPDPDDREMERVLRELRRIERSRAA